jgi:hypothetical protein
MLMKAKGKERKKQVVDDKEGDKAMKRRRPHREYFQRQETTE